MPTISSTGTERSAATEPLVASERPVFGPGSLVVLKRYETGWQWTVLDARLVKPRKKRDVFWPYKLQVTRPYDGKVVQCVFPALVA